MKNLDASLGNKIFLDESISNADGLELDTPLQAPNSSGNVVTSKSLLAKHMATPRSSVVIAPKSTAVLSEAAKNVIDAPKTEQSKDSQIPTTIYGGGGGYSAEEETKREGESEKMLFGFKAKYVYLAAALAGATFIYLKFIKK